MDGMPPEAVAQHPLNLPVFQKGFDWELTSPITILVGANGSGKSTILEAIAAHCGFALTGGTKNVAHRTSEEESLSRFLRFSWMPKVTERFFFRAETFFSFVDLLDQLAREPYGAATYDSYGGVSMRLRSHGQSFMAVFENRFGSQGLFLMDEPEAALSPQWQIEFLKTPAETRAARSNPGDHGDALANAHGLSVRFPDRSFREGTLPNRVSQHPALPHRTRVCAQSRRFHGGPPHGR
jgi:predicted ATPase